MATAWLRRLWRVWIGLAITLLALASHAIEPDAPRISALDFQRTTFTERDGAPARTWAIAQTNDGWLWFGGSTGLSRFDGLQFEKIDVSTPDGRMSGAVSALYALPSGGLVIGHMSGGISILERGKLRRFDSEAVHRVGRPADFVADANGVVWGTFENGLMRFEGAEWSVLGAEWDLPSGNGYAIFSAVDGALWVHVGNSVVRLKPRTRRFDTVWNVPKQGGLAQTSAGVLLFVTEEAMTCICGPDLVARPGASEASRKSSTFYIDRSGTLWFPGVEAVKKPWPIPAVEGIESVGNVSVILEDVEGNVWMAGPSATVHRLRRPALVRQIGQAAWTGAPAWSSFATARGGEVWMTKDSGVEVVARPYEVWKSDGDRMRLWEAGTGVAASIASDRGGDVWLAIGRRLSRWDGHQMEKWTDLPAGVADQQRRVLASGCAGEAWIGVGGEGVFRLVGRDWQSSDGLARMTSSAPTSLTCDAAGRLWVGYSDGRVARIGLDGVAAFVGFDGPNIGPVAAISVGQHVLVGGERGLALLRGQRFVRVAARLPLLQGLTGMTETADGAIWLNGAQGLIRLLAVDVDRATTTNEAVSADLFDADDGFPVPVFSLAVPTRPITRDGHGRIWFAGHGGVAYVDPSTLKGGEPPRLVLKSLSVGERQFELVDALSLPAGTRNLEIAYTALSFVHPERLRFRYRLEGVDESWVDVGGRREAIYTNLPPGKHRFSLDVTDARGAWLDRPTTLTFDIPPTFTQSVAFKVLCVAVALGLLFIAHRLRIRQLVRHQQRLMVERLDERERIARELHDTLLQGTQALILKVHSASELSRQGQPVHQALDNALDQASNAIDEARDGIEGLRNRAGLNDDFPSSLVRFGEELMKGDVIRFSVSVEGTPQALAPTVLREVYLIGREALLNASYHAKASAVELQVVFAADHLLVRVRDDGVGFQQGSLIPVPGGRHWGLPGMQERARAIPATVSIWSRPGAGTEVELKIAGDVAYVNAATRRRRSWWDLVSRAET